MQVWLILLVSSVLIPGIMLIFGFFFRYHPAKHINELYGYRTSMSMKNQKTWKFAHQYCGRIWMRCGIVMLPAAVLCMLAVINASEEMMIMVTIGVWIAAFAVLIGSVVFTEHALRKTFDSSGEKRIP